jgi:hypothetical protein
MGPNLHCLGLRGLVCSPGVEANENLQ